MEVLLPFRDVKQHNEIIMKKNLESKFFLNPTQSQN